MLRCNPRVAKRFLCQRDPPRGALRSTQHKRRLGETRTPSADGAQRAYCTAPLAREFGTPPGAPPAGSALNRGAAPPALGADELLVEGNSNELSVEWSHEIETSGSATPALPPKNAPPDMFPP